MQTTMRVKAHADDVNAVCYAEDSPNIIVTGSDDSLIKVVYCHRTKQSPAAVPRCAVLCCAAPLSFYTSTPSQGCLLAH